MAGVRDIIEKKANAIKEVQQSEFWSWLGVLAGYVDFHAVRMVRKFFEDKDMQQQLIKDALTFEAADVFLNLEAIRGTPESFAKMCEGFGKRVDIAFAGYLSDVEGTVSYFTTAYSLFHQSQHGETTSGDSVPDLALELSIASLRLKQALDVVFRLAISLHSETRILVRDSDERMNVSVKYSLSPMGIGEKLAAVTDAYSVLCNLAEVDVDKHMLQVHYVEQGSTIFAFTGLKEIMALLTKGIEIASGLVWRRVTREGQAATQGDLRAELAAAIELRNEFIKSGITTVLIDERLQKAGEEYALALLRLVSGDPIWVNDKRPPESKTRSVGDQHKAKGEKSIAELGLVVGAKWNAIDRDADRNAIQDNERGMQR